ncbi:hypothetical protein DYB32_005243 [Aphanomyces invadans]|uniref:subtilisin n=1 Tax=Aphanomyces invadans TaxID=157072 RepID=A0A3R7A8J4_9STRA|nr:hypothetical protein DYB32_005243 [Aphanomyces invadans]
MPLPVPAKSTSSSSTHDLATPRRRWPWSHSRTSDFKFVENNSYPEKDLKVGHIVMIVSAAVGAAVVLASCAEAALSKRLLVHLHDSGLRALYEDLTDRTRDGVHAYLQGRFASAQASFVDQLSAAATIANVSMPQLIPLWIQNTVVLDNVHEDLELCLSQLDGVANVVEDGIVHLPSSSFHHLDKHEGEFEASSVQDNVKDLHADEVASFARAGWMDPSITTTRPSPAGGAIKPDFVAPGVAIRSASSLGDVKYMRLTGTSMATPHVSGAAAIVWQAFVEMPHINEIDACREAFLAFDKDRYEETCSPVALHRWRVEAAPSMCGSFAKFSKVCPTNVAVLMRCPAMGQQPTEEELFQMISEVDEDMSGAIGAIALIATILVDWCVCVDFAEFLQVIDNQKDRAALYNDESDMIDAFVACGGKPDKSGVVRRDTLVKIIKVDFGLTINIEDMINKLDVDQSGEIEFDEFKAILT